MFDPMQFIKNLNYMGAGMLTIIIVMLIIILITMALNKITSSKK